MMIIRAALTVVLALALLAAPVAGEAQSTGKVARLAVLSPGPAPTTPSPLFEAFRQGLRDLGYLEGRNLTIEWRFAAGAIDRLPELASELTQLKVDVIVPINTIAALAAKKATPTIPIVFLQVADSAASGLVQSLARPGGNVTGLVSISRELSGKRLELLKEVLPHASKVAVLLYPTPTGELTFRELGAAGRQLGLRLTRVGVRGPGDLQRAMGDTVKQDVAAFVVIDGSLIAPLRAEILALATRKHLPVISQYREFADAGGLMAYGPSLPEMYRRAAQYVDKILKGAKPGDLPVEQPTKFELVINLKTAKALGLTIPQSILVRADEIIQ